MHFVLNDVRITYNTYYGDTRDLMDAFASA